MMEIILIKKISIKMFFRDRPDIRDIKVTVKYRSTGCCDQLAISGL